MHKKVFFLTALCFFISLSAYAKNGGYIVKLKEDAHFDNAEGLEILSETCRLYFAETLSDIENIKEFVEFYEKNSEIELEEETVNVMTEPSDPYYASHQTGLKMVNAQGAWNLEAYGNDVRVAVIDSGCNPHTDIINNLVEGKNYLDGSNDVTDEHGHGTNVCGIIAAEMNGIGVTGIAPKVKIVPLKCFGANGKAGMDVIIPAFEEAINNFNCQVINMSLGTTKSSESLEMLIESAYQKGIIVVAAAGNTGNEDNSLNYPAAYDKVIGVGSVNSSKIRSDFSQHNEAVFVTAPGEGVVSTYYRGGYAAYSGTSQATPFVSGFAAIALSMDKDLTVNEFMDLLKDSSENLGAEGWDEEYGYGLMNAGAAAELLASKKNAYVSPLNDNGSETYVYIRNNSETQLNALSIFASYSENALSDVVKTSLKLDKNDGIIVNFPHSDENITHFLWNYNMTPVIR